MMKKNLWKNEASSPSFGGNILDPLDEAKKDNFPLGTLRLYTGKMANGNISSHIYVKVGGKKPWAYYATYPSAKASAAIASGAMIVVNGKVTGPATPENCALFGVKHPYAGKTVPPLVKGGSKSLGSVGLDGTATINPDSVKEMEDAIAVAKGEEPSAPTGETPAPVPAPPVPPPPPPEPKDWSSIMLGLAKAVHADVIGTSSATGGLKGWTKANPELSAEIAERYGLKTLDVAYLAAQLKHSGFAATIKSNGGKEDGAGEVGTASGLIYAATKKLAADLGVPLDAPPALKVNVAEIEVALDIGDEQVAHAAESVATLVYALSHLHAAISADPTAESVAAIKSDALKALLKAQAAQQQAATSLSTVEYTLKKEPHGHELLTGLVKKFQELQAGLDSLTQSVEKHALLYQEFENTIDNALTDKLGKELNKAVADKAEKKSLEALVQYLKDIGFYDPGKQQDILSSPTVQKQLAAKYGNDWQVKAAAGAAALGTSLGSVSGGVVTAPTVNPAPAKKTKKTKKPVPSVPLAPPVAPATPVPVAPVPPPFTSVAPSTEGGLPSPSLPSLSTLTKGASAKELGGAGQKHYYTDAAGNTYLVKLAIEKDGSGKSKPFAAVVQRVYASVALAVRPDHIPVTDDVNASGQLITVQPFFAGSTTLSKSPPSSLSAQDKIDVASEHLLDWMMAQHDSHADNFIRRPDGRIVGVDKEQAFRFFPEDKLDVDYAPNPGETPYYNEFWRAFRSGSMDFDPSSLNATVAAIEAIPDETYRATIEPYAKTLWPSEPKRLAKFLDGAVSRKKHIRADFEGFITALYRKRDQAPAGVFTFASGWNASGVVSATPGAAPVAAAAPPPPPKVYKTYGGPLLAETHGLQVKPFLPTDGPGKGQTDPTKVVLRLSKHMAKASLAAFIADSGLQPLQTIEGSHYHLAIFDKAAFDAISIQKEVLPEQPPPQITTQGAVTFDTEDQASAVVETEDHAPAELNNSSLKAIEDDWLGPLGLRYSSDSTGVEGQYLRGRRVVDTNGSAYYQFQFKLRPQFAKGLSAGTPTTRTFPKLSYQPASDALHETGEQLNTTQEHPFKLLGTAFTSGASDAFIYTDSTKYAFKNACTLRIRPEPGQSVYDALRSTLNAMKPGLADAVLTDPTPQDQEVLKLARVLWNADPETSRKLKDSDYKVATLSALLAKAGVLPSETAEVEERETYPGLQSHVLPGRHKKLAGGKLKYMFNGISDMSAALSILKLGLLGVTERASAGINMAGASVDSDIGTGSGDQILARVITSSGMGYGLGGFYASGQYQAVIDPAEADRLDSYMHNEDAFGCCNTTGAHSSAWNNRASVEKRMQQQQDSFSTGTEIMFRKGIARSRILRITCQSEERRSALIQAAKARGMVQVNGISIENFVVVVKSCQAAFDMVVAPHVQAQAKKAA